MRYLIVLVCLFFASTSPAQNSADIGIAVDAFYSSIKSNNKIYFINAVYNEAPADKAGIKAGDILLTLNGKNVKQQETDELRKALFGKAGTLVVIEIKRFGVKKKFVVKRGEVPYKPAEARRSSIPALDSIKGIDIRRYFKDNGKCLVGDCEDGIGIKMIKDVMLYGNLKQDGSKRLLQLRATDRYEESEYVYSKREGKSYTEFEDGTIYITTYKDGDQHGKATQKDPDGTIQEIVFEDGVKKSSRIVKEGAVDKLTGKPPEDPYLTTIRKMSAALTEGGNRVILEENTTLSSEESHFSFKATSSPAGYNILLTYPHKNQFKVTGHFMYDGGKKVYFSHSGDFQTFSYLYLKVPAIPNKTGHLYFKHPGGYMFCKIMVVEY